MPEWAANQWISSWWIYGLAAVLLAGALAAASVRLYYRRAAASKPGWVDMLFDWLEIGLMVVVFLVFARFVTGFWH